MKASNKLIFILVLFLFVILLFADFTLRNEYARINVNDPFKNYKKLEIRPFRFLSLTGGNGYAIRVVRGDSCSLKVMSSRMSFLTHSISGDTMYVDFRVPKLDFRGGDGSNTPIGLIVSCPNLSYLAVSGTLNFLDSLTLDSLNLVAKGSSIVVFKEDSITGLHVSGADISSIVFAGRNRFGSLSADLGGDCGLALNDANFLHFYPIVKDRARVVLSASSFRQIRIANE
jgi:hypothetical protein